MRCDSAAGERLALTVPFRLRGCGGQVGVFYGVNRDPRRIGFDLLGLPFDLALTLGYPTVRGQYPRWEFLPDFAAGR